MSNSRFRPPVDRIMRAAGWWEGRVAATGPSTIAFLHEWGVPLSSAAIEVISEFDGLECHGTETGSSLSFDARAALAWSCPDYTCVFEWALGEPACPIAYGSGMIVLINGSGESLWLHDQWSGFARERTLAGDCILVRPEWAQLPE